MSFKTYTGTFESDGTSSQAITGIGFTPQIILFFNNICFGDGFRTNFVGSLGVGISSTERAAISTASYDAQITTDARHRLNSNYCIANQAYFTNTAFSLADLVSLDSDGFTLNWASDLALVDYSFIAIGGNDLTGISLDNIQSPTSTGNQATTGLGFQPDVIMAFGNGKATIDNGSAESTMSIGFGTSSTERAAYGGESVRALTPSDTRSVLDTSHVYYTVKSGDLPHVTADIVSLDSDGFTLNWDNVHTAATELFVLSLKGGQFKVGTETQKTSTGIKATTGVGFQPKGLLLISGGKTAASGITADHKLTIGAASSATQRAYIAATDNDGLTTTEADSFLSSTKAIGFLTAGTPATDAEADLDSLDSDGFTLDWTTADATAREFAYLAFGQDPLAVTIINIDTDNDVYPNQNAVISGTNFEAVKGTGFVKIAPTNDILDADAETSTPTIWSPSSITTPINQGGLAFGSAYAFVQNDSGSYESIAINISSAAGYSNVTLVVIDAAGLVNNFPSLAVGDQIEADLTTAEGTGTVTLNTDGTVTVVYSGPTPASDSFEARTWDASEPTTDKWTALQTIRLNGGLLATGTTLNLIDKLTKPLTSTMIQRLN